VVKFSREFRISGRIILTKFNITKPTRIENSIQIFKKPYSRVTERGCYLPTGLGKSLIFQALPLVIDHIEKQQGHIRVVVPPLLN